VAEADMRGADRQRGGSCVGAAGIVLRRLLPVRRLGAAIGVLALLGTASPAGALIAFRDATATGGNASRISIAGPSGTLANDVMLAAIMVRGGSSITITPPAGWTLVRRTNNGTN